jgi:hypothetical protein
MSSLWRMEDKAGLLCQFLWYKCPPWFTANKQHAVTLNTALHNQVSFIGAHQIQQTTGCHCFNVKTLKIKKKNLVGNKLLTI